MKNKKKTKKRPKIKPPTAEQIETIKDVEIVAWDDPDFLAKVVPSIKIKIPRHGVIYL